MTAEFAKQILKDWIQPDDSLLCLNPFVSWPATVFGEEHDDVFSDDIVLDGTFTVKQLEALAWWMRNKTT